MKFVLIAFVCFIAFQQASTQFFGMTCPKVSPGLPKSSPAPWKYYLVLRFKMNNMTEVPKCRNFKLIANPDKSLTFNQSVVGPFDVVLNQTFVAKPNASGYWDVTENGKPSSTIFMDTSLKTTIIYTCKHELIMPLIQGVYSQSKTLSGDEMKRVSALLKKNNVTMFETVDQTNCKN